MKSIRSPDAGVPTEDREELQEIYAHLQHHGDSVKDVFFEIDNVQAVHEQAVLNEAVSMQELRVGWSETSLTERR